MPTAIEQSPAYFRSATAKGGCPQVFRTDGAFGSGVIYGVSVITAGEALGHDLWIDQDFLSDVAGAINAVANTDLGGVKARLTHPGLSSDGVATKLGRVRNASVIDGQVFADLHFQEAATRTPDGDLADYVMTLAEETPEDFGLSIVFEHDLEAADVFVAEHTFNNRFVSPDELNKNNYPHARLSALRAVDAVDSPAANPAGLFQRGQEAARDGEQFLEYVLGFDALKPQTSMFGVDPDRAAIFVKRFLERHNLTLVTKGGDPVDTDVSTVEAPVDAPTREDFAAELGLYVEKFGSENGAKWLSEGVSFSDALELHIAALEADIELKNEKIKELETTLSSLDRGDDEGAEFADDDESPVEERSLRNRIRIQGRASNN